MHMYQGQQIVELKNFPRLVKILFGQDLFDPKVFDIVFADRDELRSSRNGIPFVARRIARYMFELYAQPTMQHNNILIDGSERFIRFTYNDIKNTAHYVISANIDALPIVFMIEGIPAELKSVIDTVYGLMKNSYIKASLDLQKLLATVKTNAVVKQVNKLSVGSNVLPYLLITRGLYSTATIDNPHIDDLYNTTIVIALVPITEFDIPFDKFYSANQNDQLELADKIDTMLNVYAVGDYQMLSEIALFFLRLRIRL